MGALVQVYRPAPMPGDAAADGSPSDRADHIVVVNLRGPVEPSPRLPAYKLASHERYPVATTDTVLEAVAAGDAWLDRVAEADIDDGFPRGAA